VDLENRNFIETLHEDDLNSYKELASPIIKKVLTKVIKNIKV